MLRSALLFFASLLAVSSQAGLQANFDYKQFLIPGEGTFIETHLEFEGKSLMWGVLNEGDETHVARVRATIVLSQNGTVVDFKKITINSLPLPLGEVTNFLDIQRLIAPTGNYLLEVELADLNDPESAPISFNQAITVDLAIDQVGISGITLVEAYTKANTPTELTKSGMDILPYIADFYPESSNKIVFYAEAYNSDKFFQSYQQGENEHQKYLFTYSIWNEGGMVPNTQRHFRKIVAPVNPILESVDITDLPSGNYQLVIEMRTPENTEMASESIAFRRQAALRMDDLLSDESYVTKPGLAFNNPDSITAYVEWLYPIAQNVERNTITSQVKGEDPEVLRNFFFSFWERIEPDNPIEAWLSYVREVWYVNRKYKSPVKPGFRTDRGRVWLQYGKPNTIVLRHNETDVFPYEIWHYYKIERFNDKRFLFYSRSVVNYDFDLLHSDMLGEVQNFDWPTLMRTKNNDLRPSDSAVNRMAPRDTYSMDELEDLFYNPR